MWQKNWSHFSGAALLAFVALLTAGASGVALAHDDAYLDAQKAPHGGQLRMAGAQHLELVLVKDSASVRDNPILVYVTDHAGLALSTQGATGTITLLSGKNKVTAALQPDGENRLKAVAQYGSTPGIKAVVSVQLKGQGAQQARFTPF